MSLKVDLSNFELPLQLLLFVDKRPSSGEQIRQIRSCLKDFQTDYDFDLQVIDVSEQPYLAEHFKVIATPALLKIHPDPRQTLAGSDLVTQLLNWWPRWQRAIEESLPSTHKDPTLAKETEQEEVQPSAFSLSANSSTKNSVAYTAELIRLSDEIFRLQQEKEELREQLQFKDRIIAMLAHDLRNPLTAASIALETLEIGNQSQDGQAPRLTPALTAQLLKHARSQTKAIDRMITDILQSARGNSAELKMHLQKLDLEPLCQEVLRFLEDRFQAKAQEVETDIPMDLPPVYADRERVRQVLINLLDNAIKYTPPGGLIHVSILHRTTQKLQVSICDNGPGIPIENRKSIFEDRVRLKRDEAQEGYGIGLSLCQRIVRAHYGQIWVDATFNEGSCFHFTLLVYRS